MLQTGFGEGVAALAVANARDRLLQRIGDPPRAVAVVLQQVPGHALRRLDADAGEAAQRLDRASRGPTRPLAAGRAPRGAATQSASERTAASCRAASGMPAVSLPIFSWLTASARRTPSLNAAATRSSSMSLSSPSRLGSIDDALDVVLAGHRHLHQAGARLALDLDRRELVLRLLQVVLHRLGLLHQTGELTFHHVVCSLNSRGRGASGCRPSGLTEPGTIAPSCTAPAAP